MNPALPNLATPPQRVLIIVTRRIGDVLLATPLIHTLKSAWPDAKIDALVFEGTQGALSAHPDLHYIHVVPERPGLLQHIVFIAHIFRRYDLALSLLPGDRPTLYAWIAGRLRAGLYVDGPKQQWKRWLLNHRVDFDDRNTHTVRMNLALAGTLGITPRAEVGMHWSAKHEQELASACPFDTTRIAYAVIHVFPKFNYKMWHAQGWAQLAQWLTDSGLRIVMTGGADQVERDYVSTIATSLPGQPVNLAGKISLAAAACLTSRARLYIGPDTAMTHVAAATGVPTIALFGPSNPVKWGPWPRDHDPAVNPWQRSGSQSCGNVVLLQGAGSCVPCHREGCDRHINSYSDCLQQLSAQRVIRAAAELLTPSPSSERP